MDRLERERSFHNEQADGFHARRRLNRMGETFYDKGEDSILWASMWRTLDLSGKTVLDYGCGAGGFSLELVKRASIVYGIDISENLITLARKSTLPLGARQPAFSVQDATQTEFPPGFFDFVFGNGILHHLEIERAYAEIARILKPGGRAFFAEPLDRHPLVRLVRRVTPNARTLDEKPLSFGAISQARQFFARVRHTESFFLAVAAAPLHLISSRVAGPTVKLLHRLDQALFDAIPGLRPYAWLTLIELEKS